jgi:hypothetical protein
LCGNVPVAADIPEFAHNTTMDRNPAMADLTNDAGMALGYSGNSLNVISNAAGNGTFDADAGRRFLQPWPGLSFDSTDARNPSAEPRALCSSA